MQDKKASTKDIALLSVAAAVIILCLVVLISNFPGRKNLSVLGETPTPVPTAAPTPETVTEEQEVSVPVFSEESLNEEHALALMESMTTAEKIWQMLMVTPEAIAGVSPVTTNSEELQAALAEYPVGGLIYGAQNAEDEEQLRTMLQGVQDYAQTALFLADGADVAESGLTLSDRMYYLGFNLCFGETDNGLMSAMPYEAGMTLDNISAIIVSDTLIPVEAEEESYEAETESEDGNAAAAAIPEFMSAEYISGIRTSLDWNGIIATEELSGGIDGYTDAELLIGAVNAGCDMIVGLDDPVGAAEALLQAVTYGEISQDRLNESVRRILLEKIQNDILIYQQPAEVEEEQQATR